MSQELEKRIQQLEQENARLKFELESVKKELSEQYELLHHEHQELSDSINYAKRIQGAIQPPISLIKELLPKSFVLYLPKDVVSGDFYFARKYDNGVIFAAVDCTGHGIPGALMSVVGFNYLDQAVTEGIVAPSEIMSYLDAGVNEKLRQTGGESGVNDGMDLGLCSIEGTKLQYSGAYNPLYIISTREVIEDNVLAESGSRIDQIVPKSQLEDLNLFEVKPDKYPIGVNLDGVTDVYTNHTIELEKGDVVYLFSDGYADQFGGEKDKKYKYRQMREYLLSVSQLEMEEQHQQLENEFYRWKGENDQVDDVIIFGVKI